MPTHPILVLESYIAECASRIAPEKSDCLQKFADENDLLLEINRDKKFTIRVNLTTNLVKLPIGALSYVWCATHLFVVLYNVYVKNQKVGATILDTGSNPSLSSAIDLFNWATNGLVNGDEEWPTDSPRPADAFDGNTAHLTNELFLAAMAWIIHHERAHIELQHGKGLRLNSVADEIAADRSATEWVLDGVQDIGLRERRALGIAVAVLAMVLLDDPHFPPGEVRTHPPDLERLFENISLAKLPAESYVYSFCAVILQFCTAQYSQADAADKGGASLEDLFRDFLVVYQRRHRL